MKISWPFVLATLFLAGTVHLAAVLSIPYLASNNGWARLAGLADANTLSVLPPARPGEQPLPFMAPDVRYAICPYDLADGPVRLALRELDDLWMIAFYTPQGDNFYAISGSDLKREQIDVVISTQAETLMQIEAEAADDVENVIVVRAPRDSGLAVVRVPLPGAVYSAQVERTLAQASCAPWQTPYPLMSAPPAQDASGG